MRSLSIFGIILFAAVGTNAMSMEKTHNKQQKFLRVDARGPNVGQKFYVAGEIQAGFMGPGGAGSLSLKAKVSVDATLSMDAMAQPAVYSVAVNGVAAIGLQCEIACTYEFKVQISYALSVELPIPHDVAMGCPREWVFFVLAYMVESYVRTAVNNAAGATTTLSNWWQQAGVAAYVAAITNWGYDTEVQTLLMRVGCDKSKVKYTAKIKTAVGTPDTSFLQMMMSDSTDSKGQHDSAARACTFSDNTDFITYGAAIKPFGDFLKATIKYKTKKTPAKGDLPEVSFKLMFRVVSKTKNDPNSVKKKQHLIGGAMKPIENAFNEFFKSWGNKPPTSDDAVPDFLTKLGETITNSDLFNTVKNEVALIPFLKDFVVAEKDAADALKKAGGLAAKVAPFSVSGSVEDKERKGVDISCKFTYDQDKILKENKAYPAHTALKKLDSTSCTVGFVYSKQKTVKCALNIPLAEFKFKGVVGEETFVEMGWEKDPAVPGRRASVGGISAPVPNSAAGTIPNPAPTAGGAPGRIRKAGSM